MQQMVEDLGFMVSSYEDTSDPKALEVQAAVILDSVREDIQMSMEITPDNIAFGIYPNVFVKDRGQMFLRQYDVVVDELPSWQEVSDQKFFQINGEKEFIRSLPIIDEEVAVKILFAIAYVKANQPGRQ